ncbi:tetraspanin-9-like [Syngnathus typhle]|uniref:tetraspanin-9-like n=1 Tax=Syngnathus typhle TaxID=161592 RepID=UPI002A6A03F6|nr:tetraspanin-9-like [Syngnathus typhle]XP_061124172.1 tetraspanin-9-like [Syngnathus typhle]
MARGCVCCVKYMLFLFNLLFWLGGCGLLGVGVWLSVSQGNFAALSPSFPSMSAANLIVMLGTVVMVTGFLGCLGAIKENKCLLLSFFIVLLIILLAELILLILFFVYTDKVSENARRDLKDGLVLYNTDNNAGLRDAWDAIQGEWHCCGVTSFSDWRAALQVDAVPDSCCQLVHSGCGRNASDAFWTRGCYEKMEEWLDDNKHLLGTIAMCVLVIQLLGMAFSMTLYQQIHRGGIKYQA